jgi:hypothetical protein
VEEHTLNWSFNPWRADWRRPALALAACLAVAAVFGYSVAVPNFSGGYMQRLREEGRLVAYDIATDPAEAGEPLTPQNSIRVEPVADVPAAVACGELTAAQAQAIEQARGMVTRLEAQERHWRGQWLAWSAISLLFLLGMTLVIYTPVGYTLDARGVTVRFMGVDSFRPWEHYRNFYAHARVVHLTTMPRPSRLDPFRGHPLQFSGNRDRVLAYLGGHIAKSSTNN